MSKIRDDFNGTISAPPQHSAESAEESDNKNCKETHTTLPQDVWRDICRTYDLTIGDLQSADVAFRVHKKDSVGYFKDLTISKCQGKFCCKDIVWMFSRNFSVEKTVVEGKIYAFALEALCLMGDITELWLEGSFENDSELMRTKFVDVLHRRFPDSNIPLIAHKLKILHIGGSLMIPGDIFHRFITNFSCLTSLSILTPCSQVRT